MVVHLKKKTLRSVFTYTFWQVDFLPSGTRLTDCLYGLSQVGLELCLVSVAMPAVGSVVGRTITGVVGMCGFC